MITTFVVFRIKQIARLIRDAGAGFAVLAFVFAFLLTGFMLQPHNALAVTLLLVLLLTQVAGLHATASNTLYHFSGRPRLFIADALLLSILPLAALLYNGQPWYVAATLLYAAAMYAVVALQIFPAPRKIRSNPNPFRLSHSPEALCFNRKFLSLVILIYIAVIIASLAMQAFALPVIGVLIILNFWLSVLLMEEPISVILLYRRHSAKSFIRDRLKSRTLDFVKLTLPLLVLSIALQLYHNEPHYVVILYGYTLMLAATPLTLLIKLSDINNKRRNTLLAGMVAGLLLASFVYPHLLFFVLVATFWATQRARGNMDKLLAE